MKSLKYTLQESLRIGINDKPYTASPTTWEELRQIIENRYEELGPGTVSNPIDFNDINVSEIPTFYNASVNDGIFNNTNFEYIDVSDWDVSNIESMTWMFAGCYKLKSIDISNWNVSNVQDMEYMFYECFRLESIGDISNWNISNVKNVKYMFSGCEKLKSVGDLSNWNVSNVRDTWKMFDGSGITNIPDWYKE